MYYLELNDKRPYKYYCDEPRDVVMIDPTTILHSIIIKLISLVSFKICK